MNSFAALRKGTREIECGNEKKQDREIESKNWAEIPDAKRYRYQSAASMKNAVGFRNVAVHCYDDLNIDIVFAICIQRLDDFKQFSKEVYEFIQAGDS